MMMLFQAIIQKSKQQTTVRLIDLVGLFLCHTGFSQFQCSVTFVPTSDDLISRS